MDIFWEKKTILYWFLEFTQQWGLVRTWTRDLSLFQIHSSDQFCLLIRLGANFNLYNILSFYAWVLDLWIMYSCSWFFLLSFKNDIIMTYHLIYEISEWSPAEIIQNLSTEMKNRFCCNFYTINTSIVIFCNSTIGFIWWTNSAKLCLQPDQHGSWLSSKFWCLCYFIIHTYCG